MDRITMNPNGTSHQTQICFEGPVSTRLESTPNLAILIAIDAIGDDHIFFIQARNLAGPPRFPKRWCAAQIWADNLILDGCSFAFAFYRRILASYQAIG